MSTKITKLNGKAFLSFPEQAELLQSELKKRFNFSKKPDAVYGELLYFDSLPENPSEPILPYWARTVMLEPFILNFESIGEAAGELKKIQRNWAPYQYRLFRRANLIQNSI